MNNYFKELNNISVSEKIEKKGKLSYLSWAWAWGELKKKYPEAISTVYEQENGLNYWHDNKTGWVKTGVTVEGIEHIEYLPIMNHSNKSIAVNEITSTDVNKAIQRCITKAIARHGLGLYIYAGEDLPEDTKKEKIDTIDFVNEKMKELVDFHGNKEAVYQIMGIEKETFLHEYKNDIQAVANRINTLINGDRKNHDKVVEQTEATEQAEEVKV